MGRNYSGDSGLNTELMSPSTKSLVDCDEQKIFFCILVAFLECVKSSCLLITFTTKVNINYINGRKWRNALMGH